MPLEEQQEYELSEHDKQMIAVAEGGDPNDPSELNTNTDLPSEELEDEEYDDEELEDEEYDPRLEAAENKLREYAAYEVVGGKEQYQELAEWASDNLSEEQLDVYNQAVEQGSPEMVKFAVQALSAQAQLANINNFGQQGSLTNASGSQSTAITGYGSQQEMIADMADPRYQNDPAYQQKVAHKLAVTTAF